MQKFGYNFTKIRSYRWDEFLLSAFWRQPVGPYLGHYLYQLEFLISWLYSLFHTCLKILKNRARISKICKKFAKSQTSSVYWIVFEMKACSVEPTSYMICKSFLSLSFENSQRFQNSPNISVLECFLLSLMCFLSYFTFSRSKYSRIQFYEKHRFYKNS